MNLIDDAMSRLLVTVLFLFVCLSAESQLSIGMRDTRYVNVAYMLKKHYIIKLEHSVFSAKIKQQYLRGYVGYMHSLKNDKWQFSANAYAGSAYAGSFYNLGADIGCRYRPSAWMSLRIDINPHFDSLFKYNTCCLFGVGFYLHKNIDLVCEYTTIPEYREAERRFRAGLNFHIGNVGGSSKLSVLPMLSVPAEGDVKTLRIHANMKFVF